MALDFYITLALALVIIAIAVGMTARNRRPRPLIAGLGLAAVVVGLYLTGITNLTINGIMSLVDWLQRTVWTDVITWGLGLIVGGIVAFIASRFLAKGAAPRPEPQAEQRRQVPGATQRQVPGGPAGATPVKQATPAPKQKAPGLSDEDAEIEALLRKRGIM